MKPNEMLVVDNETGKAEIFTLNPEGTRTINIYLDNGVVYYYNVSSPIKAREHADAIVKNGYRHNTKDGMEVYPAHRIAKVHVTGGPLTTNYEDQVRGT